MAEQPPAKSTVGAVSAKLQRLLREGRLLQPDTARSLDRRARGLLAKPTRGMSPLAIMLAGIDWLGHLAVAPGKELELVESLVRKGLALGVFNLESLLRRDPTSPAASAERRLSSDGWRRWPFSMLSQSWLLSREWWREATTDVSGVSLEHEQLLAFLGELLLQALSPANFPLTNPEVLAETRKQKGANLLRGLKHGIADLRRRRRHERAPGTERFRVGKEVAITPGKVIYQNRLIEVIQYASTTPTVGAEPVLIVPAWIMKYYILDLSPKNSLVRYLVEQGKTVFAISWKNPTAEDSQVGMDDYLRLGVLAALDAVTSIVPQQRVNLVGYCIGGTLAYIAAAYLAREGDQRLKSLSIFAAQADFREAGEIRRFLGDSIFAHLEARMSRQGYLSVENMGGAFSALRSADLIWGPLVDRYFLGKELSLNDLMAWNADGTRMPCRMHSEYLRKLYLDNDLAEGRYIVDGRVISLSDIDLPLFVVGTVTDHVAPWRSVYKIHLLNSGEISFLLTTAGHNAGIVSGPSNPQRKYQLRLRKRGDHYLAPELWQRETPVVDGSWWPVWNDWLERQISTQLPSPSLGAPSAGYQVLRDAPGEYVLG
jgi:polyhydroxyalkanoate synthase